MFKNWITCKAMTAVSSSGVSRHCGHRFPPSASLYPWIYCGGDVCLRSPDRLKKRLKRESDE